MNKKTILITGGSGGIGSAIIEAFVRDGARVFALDRKEKRANAKNGSGRVTFVKCDITKPSAVRRTVKKVVRLAGAIDVLVNCAGIQAPIGPFLENNFNEWTRNVATNLFGTVLLTKEVLPSMVKRHKGSIINFSGGGATSSRPNFSAYAVSKIGIVKFTEILADEVKQYGIKVNVIAPGAVNTAMLHEVLKIGKKAGDKELKESIARSIKGGTPPELAARLVCFLASDASDGLTGRLVSAPWDSWAEWKKSDIKAIMKSEKFTLRRVK